jgi:hypothetical protein
MATATKTTPRKGVERKTSTRVKKGAKAAATTQTVHPAVDDSDSELEKALKDYFAKKDDHGELTRELTADKQRVLALLHDKKLKRYWSKRMERGVELVPEGEKLAEAKHPDKKPKGKKQPAATD